MIKTHISVFKDIYLLQSKILHKHKILKLHYALVLLAPASEIIQRCTVKIVFVIVLVSRVI